MASSRVGLRINGADAGGLGCLPSDWSSGRTKGQRLAGAGLRRGDDVAAGERRAEWPAPAPAVGLTKPFRARLRLQDERTTRVQKKFSFNLLGRESASRLPKKGEEVCGSNFE